MSELEKLLEEAVIEGLIHCPKCGTALEPDAKKCPECGWKNPLILEGFI